MAQKAILNTPVPPPAAVSEYEIAAVLIQRKPVWKLAIRWVDNLGVYHNHHHTGVFHAVNNPNGADVMVKALNTANGQTKSIEQRAKEHLDTCTTGLGDTPGPATMTGSPD